jgi:hypothetical protein
MLKRAILLVAGPLAALLVTVVTALLLAGDLPDPIATHWGTSGEPDGHMPLPVFLVAVVAAEAVAWGALLWQARARGRDGLQLTVAPYAWATIAFVAALALITLAANAEAADWRAADEVGLLSVAIALGVGALAGLTGWALERRRPLGTGVAEIGGAGAGAASGAGAAGVDAGGAGASARLAPGERAVWSRSLVSRPAAAGAVVLLAGFVVAGLLTGGGTGWLLVGAGLVVAASAGTLSEIVATVDARGLTIAYGPFGWPRKRVALDQIAHADTLVVEPLKYGGWGYRKVPRRAGVTAVVLRRGEGLRVVSRDGRELIVTIDDAAAGAALLEALRASTR